MRVLSLIPILLGLLIEALACYVFFVYLGSSASGWLLAAVLLHVLAAVIVTLGIYIALPAAYRMPRAGALAFIGSSALLLPMLGPLGLAMAMLWALHWAYKAPVRAWDTLAIPDLPFQPVEVDTGDVFLRDGLSSVLMHFDDRNRRQQAILACRHLPNRQAVPILRSGLGDAADEVRLLAYAMLNAIESNIDKQLTAVAEAIRSGGDADGSLHEEQARLYWEFSYLELASGTIESVLLDKALTALNEAIDRQNTPQRWLLYARICLALGRYDQAEQALRKADDLGVDPDDSASRWAELAFKRGRYADIVPALARMSPRATDNPVMRPVVEYWL